MSKNYKKIINMKLKNPHLTLLFFFFLHSILINAQTSKNTIRVNELPVINLTDNVSLHFISPEPIQFVDLSTDYLIGDLPTEQISRIKINPNSSETVTISDNVNSYETNGKKRFLNGEYLGIITIVGQSFMAQYKIVYNLNTNYDVISNIKIKAEDMQPLEFFTMNISDTELKLFCNEIEAQKNKNPIRKSKDMKLKMTLNNVYVIDDYIFIDLSIKNKTNLTYDIDAIKFTVEDKKIYKATNNQSVFLNSIYSHNKAKKFKRNYRNIFVFKKFTFPNSKVLLIRLIENQMSGRTIELQVKYSDVLNADSI